MTGTKTKLLITALVALVLAAPAAALFEKYQPEVVVSDPFIEMRTGPGRGYPIYYVAGQGDRVTLIKRRNDWFKITSPRGKSGWVHIDQMKHTLDLDGEEIDWGELGIDSFSKRRWEFGVMGGDFAGASSLSAYLGFAMTPNITLAA